MTILPAFLRRLQRWHPVLQLVLPALNLSECLTLFLIEELGVLFTRMGVPLLHLELAEAMREMDTDKSDGSSQVTLEMLTAWLHKRGLLASDDPATGCV